MSPRLGIRILQMVLVCALVVTALPGSSQAAAPAPDPTQDKVKLPAHCTLRAGGHMTYKAAPCYLTKFRKNRPTLVLWGDSHSWQQIPALRPLARRHNVNLVMYMLGGCAPFLVRPRTKQTLYACEKSNKIALQFVRKLKREKRPVRVLLGAHWQGYPSFYRRIYVEKSLKASDYPDSFLRSIRKFRKRTPRLFRELGRLRVRTDVIGQAPIVPENPPYCARPEPYSCALARNKFLPEEGKTMRWLKRVMQPLPRWSRVIKYHSPYCNRRKCFGKVGDIYTFYDIWHLSATRARTLRKYFRPTVRSLG